MDLTAREREILLAVASGPIAWRRPFAVALELGVLPPPAIIPELRELIGRGFLEPWDLPSGQHAVTLTPLAAETLGLVLIESGPLEWPRWSEADRPPPPIVARPDPTLTGREPARTILDDPQFRYPRTRKRKPHYG